MKKALCIGINDYPGVNNDLYGCINDANDWAVELKQRGFDVQQLLDKQATKEAMVSGIEALIQEARSGDIVVITYSGHGSWIPDLDGDEFDKRDEVLCPYDIGQNRPLVDDELYDMFAQRERGVRIVFIADSCHSGTLMKFPIGLEGVSGTKTRFLPPEHFLPQGALAKARAIEGNRSAGGSRPFGGVLLSGCQDTEYSYDAVFNGRPNGAFSYFALKSLQELHAEATYRDWYKAIRAFLPNPYHPQRPNLQGSSSQKRWKVLA